MAKRGHSSQKRGAPTPWYPTSSMGLRQIFPIRSYEKQVTPVPGGGTVPKRSYRDPPATSAPIELRGGKTRKPTQTANGRTYPPFLRSINNDAASSFPTAHDSGSRAPNDARPCLRNRGRDAADNTSYPNLDSNESYAAACGPLTHETIFTQVPRQTFIIHTGFPRQETCATSLFIRNATSLARAFSKKRRERRR